MEFSTCDVAAIIGHRPTTWAEGERQLERLVIGADPQSDGTLIRLFHRRLERQRGLSDQRDLPGATHKPLPPMRPSR